MLSFSPQRTALAGTAYILSATAFWGTTGTVAKYAYNTDIPATMLAAARIHVAFLALFAFLLLRRPALLRVPGREIPHLAVFGLIGLGLCQYTYLYTMTQASVSVAVLLQSTSTAWIYLYALLSRQERLSGVKLSALLLALSGCAVVVLGRGGWGGAITPAGLLSGFVSAACVAFHSLRAKPWLATYSPWTILVWGLGTAAPAWWIIHPPAEIIATLAQNRGLALAVLYLGVFSTVIPFGLFLCGVARLLPSTASILGTFEPVAATLCAYLLLGETITAMQGGGGLLILAAIVLLHVTPRRAAVSTAAAAAPRSAV